MGRRRFSFVCHSKCAVDVDMQMSCEFVESKLKLI